MEFASNSGFINKKKRLMEIATSIMIGKIINTGIGPLAYSNFKGVFV